MTPCKRAAVSSDVAAFTPADVCEAERHAIRATMAQIHNLTPDEIARIQRELEEAK